MSGNFYTEVFYNIECIGALMTEPFHLHCQALGVDFTVNMVLQTLICYIHVYIPSSVFHAYLTISASRRHSTTSFIGDCTVVHAICLVAIHFKICGTLGPVNLDSSSSEKTQKMTKKYVFIVTN